MLVLSELYYQEFIQAAVILIMISISGLVIWAKDTKIKNSPGHNELIANTAKKLYFRTDFLEIEIKKIQVLVEQESMRGKGRRWVRTSF